MVAVCRVRGLEVLGSELQRQGDFSEFRARGLKKKSVLLLSQDQVKRPRQLHFARNFLQTHVSCSQSHQPLDSSPPQVHRIWGICGSYFHIPKAVFYLLRGDFKS